MTERQIEPVKANQFKAICPKVSTHNAVVYDVKKKEIKLDRTIKGVGKKGDKVKVGVRFCKCNDCGATWRETADVPEDTSPALPKYPEVKCKNQRGHQEVEAYKREQGKLFVVCHQCAQDNTWMVKDEISEPKPEVSGGSAAGRKVPPHKRSTEAAGSGDAPSAVNRSAASQTGLGPMT